jgi:pyrroloquinoline quinone (PQQ) biosynthesis protein C
VADADVDFFRIHVECDDGHAETIRDIMVNIGREDDAQIGIMLRAGQSLIDYRLGFFSAIEAEHRARQDALATA